MWMQHSRRTGALLSEGEVAGVPEVELLRRQAPGLNASEHGFQGCSGKPPDCTSLRRENPIVTGHGQGQEVRETEAAKARRLLHEALPQVLPRGCGMSPAKILVVHPVLHPGLPGPVYPHVSPPPSSTAFPRCFHVFAHFPLISFPPPPVPPRFPPVFLFFPWSMMYPEVYRIWGHPGPATAKRRQTDGRLDNVSLFCCGNLSCCPSTLGLSVRTCMHQEETALREQPLVCLPPKGRGAANSTYPPLIPWDGEGPEMGECLPSVRPVHARHATFILSILSLAPSFFFWLRPR